jgi:hypothetical protein
VIIRTPTSLSWPLFEQHAVDLALRLEPHRTEEAQTMLREARDLHRSFREWQQALPADEVRVPTIRRLFDLQRRVMDYLALHGERP